MLEGEIENTKLRDVVEFEIDFILRSHEKELAKKDEIISEQNKALKEMDKQINERNKVIEEKKKILAKLEAQLK